MDSNQKWELGNSLWILISLLFFVNGFAFFYIGQKVQNKKWIFYGIIYELPIAFLVLINDIIPNGVYVCIGILMISCVISFLHALLIHEEYLDILRYKINNNKINLKSKEDIINYFWIIISIIPFINGIPLMILGLKEKIGKWIFYGLFFELPTFIYFIIYTPNINNSLVMDIFITLLFVSAILSFAYSLIIIEEYFKKQDFTFVDSPIPNTLNINDGFKSEGYNDYSNIKTSFNNSSFENTEIYDIVDINNASAEEISTLPEINIVLAKKIVQYRDEGFEFNSLDQLSEKMNLKPNQIERIKPYVKFNPEEVKPNENKGRKVDF